MSSSSTMIMIETLVGRQGFALFASRPLVRLAPEPDFFWVSFHEDDMPPFLHRLSQHSLIKGTVHRELS